MSEDEPIPVGAESVAAGSENRVHERHQLEADLHDEALRNHYAAVTDVALYAG
jgi:hypothetical protein